ncbi:hypothetical protein FOZ60_000386 [Perkinsus olseni]|uniref:Uncharacterized protein n=2 Tax=Perkinsus olseni TaxID=32597 RepID=A0A7J6P2J0_PEROL|nr:hypothetical protein FOZ60_000386 [Perkinsus olseni]
MPSRHCILGIIGLMEMPTGSDPPLPSTGVYVSMPDAELPIGVSGVEVEVKDDGVRIVADLMLNRFDGGQSSIRDLEIRRMAWVGRSQDWDKFREAACGNIMFFSPTKTQICVDRDSSDRKGKYSRAKLLLGRLFVDGSHTAQFNISLVLDENRPAGRTIFEEPLNTHNKMRMHSDYGLPLYIEASVLLPPSGGEPTVDQDGPMDLSMKRSHDPLAASVDTGQGDGQLMGRKRARKQSKPRRILEIDRREDDEDN